MSEQRLSPLRKAVMRELEKQAIASAPVAKKGRPKKDPGSVIEVIAQPVQDEPQAEAAAEAEPQEVVVDSPADEPVEAETNTETTSEEE